MKVTTGETFVLGVLLSEVLDIVIERHPEMQIPNTATIRYDAHDDRVQIEWETFTSSIVKA